MSFNKLFGITKAKRSIAKVTGIPTTVSGRSRKAKRLWMPISGMFWLCLCVILLGMLSNH